MPDTNWPEEQSDQHELERQEAGVHGELEREAAHEREDLRGEPAKPAGESGGVTTEDLPRETDACKSAGLKKREKEEERETEPETGCGGGARCFLPGSTKPTEQHQVDCEERDDANLRARQPTKP